MERDLLYVPIYTNTENGEEITIKIYNDYLELKESKDRFMFGVDYNPITFDMKKDCVRWLNRNMLYLKPISTEYKTSGPILQCLKCNTFIFSASNHDFRSCKCKLISVDGGASLPRFIGSPENYKVMTELDKQ